MAANDDSTSELEIAVFRAAPKEFMAARTALHDALKLAGRTDEAKRIKAWRRPTVPVWLWNRLVLDEDEHADEAVTEATALAAAITAGENAALATGISALRAAALDVVRAAQKVAAYCDVGFSNAQERELTELVLALPWPTNAEFREAAAQGRVQEMPPAVDPLEAMRISAAGAPTVKSAPIAPAPAPVVKLVDDAAAKAAAARAKRDAAIAAAKATLVAAEAALAQAQTRDAAAQRDLARARATLADAEAAAQRTAAALETCTHAVDEARAGLLT